jgi:hypothetical protein
MPGLALATFRRKIAGAKGILTGGLDATHGVGSASALSRCLGSRDILRATQTGPSASVGSGIGVDCENGDLGQEPIWPGN